MPIVSLQEVICSSSTSNFKAFTRLSRVTVWPVVYNKSALVSSGAFTGHGISSISSKMPLNPSNPGNTSASSCCFVVQDTIDVRYWAGECLEKILRTFCY